MFQLGKNLLAHYPFITTLTTKDIYVRSTDYARTLESVHYLVSGLDIDITIHVKSEETMFPDEKCKSLQVMVKAFKDIPKAGNDALMNGHSQYDAAA